MSDKKILDPDWMPKEESGWELKQKVLDDGANPRILLHLNMSAKAPFYGIIEAPGIPPMAVCVTRADMDLVAMGVMEKMKLMIQQLQVKFSTIAKLTQGIRGTDLSKLPMPNGVKQ